MQRIYLISHYRNRASEVWLHRIRDAIGYQICGEAYFDVGDHSPGTVYQMVPGWWRVLLRTGLVNDWKYATPGTSGLATAIRDAKPDLVYCHFANLAVRLQKVWKKSDLPVAVHCHGFDVSFDLLDEKGRPRHSKSYSKDVASLIPRCHLISNSEFSRQNLIENGVAASGISTWHFGVPSRYEDRPLITTRLQLLFLGRFIGCKGPLETLRAFAMARSQGLTANLVMAGDGPLMNECRRLATSLGVHNDVTFPGVVDADQASRLFRESHIFTAHTQRDPVTRQCEAFGVAFAEALGAGLPVITGNHAGPATYLTHNHDSLLFEPGDIDAHAQSLLNVASDHDLRARLSRNTHSTARQKFDLERQHAELLNLLSRFAGSSE